MSQLESSSLSSPSFARYLYVASLLRGRRVLDIGVGGAKSARFVADRGARSVLSLHVDGPPGSSATIGSNASARSVARGDLTRAGGLIATTGSEPFEVIFLHATPELLSAAFLADLRRVLAKNGHLIVAARSKESFANAAEAVGYFDLLDGLTQAGYGPVSMLGQTPFFGAAVVPFGTNEPPLFFDDTLAPPEQPEEYVALCGPLPPAALPYQVVKLARPAEQPVGKSEAKADAASPQIIAERDGLKGRVEMLLADLEQRQQELTVQKAAQRGLEDRLRAAETAAKTATESATAEKTALKAEQQKLEKRLEESISALRAAESQRHELEEQKRQRERGESEAGQAAMLHERQMRELRAALEEREAFVVELEEQTRELPRISEQLIAARKLSEESQKSERHTRQRLAEVEGLLLRAKHELKDREKDSRLAAELETRQRELEAERRGLVLQRVEMEQAEQALATKRSAVEQAEKAVQKTQASTEREAALGEVRRELLSAQERLQQLHADLEQRTRSLTDAQTEIERLRSVAASTPRVEHTALLVAPTLGSGRRVDSDGVPLLVGDMPTAPVLVGAIGGEGQPSLQQEISQLRQRVAELNAENERLKDKATEAERETWKHMKARSEAEQASAEVREDTVRKLRDARKLASVELTRAMEDATKKAVQLREELARTEIERKEALAQLKELRGARDIALEQAAAAKQELDSLRWAQGAAASTAGGGHELSEERQRALSTLNEERTARQAAQQAADEAQLRVAELRSAVMALEQAVAETRARAEQEQQRVEGLEEELRQSGGDKSKQGTTAEQLRLQQELQQQSRALAERTAERDALARLLTEVEREAAARAERARAMRVRLSEREREVEALRVELGDRERKLSALEQQSPPSEEMTRLETELQTTRRRISELLDETARTEQHGDDAVATALRERARAVRMNESLDQASRERDEARSRSLDLEQRLKEALADAERLRLELVQRGQGHSANTPDADAAESERRAASNNANNG